VGEGPQILGPELQKCTTFNHVAKFHGDRPRELEDLALKKVKEKKRNISSKTKPPGTT